MMADLLPTKEELDFLQLREQLKQRIRNKRMKTSGYYTHDHCSLEKAKLPCDNFGSFFGSSQPAIAERLLIQGSRGLTEELKINKDKQNLKNTATTKSGPTEPKSKCKQLKESRDYSFLSKDNAEVPTTTKKEAGLDDKGSMKNLKCVKKPHLEEKKRHHEQKGRLLMPKQASLKHQDPEKCKASLAKPQSSLTNQNIKQAKETTVQGEPGLLGKDSLTNTKCVKSQQHLEEKERHLDQKGRHVMPKQASLKQQNHPEKCKASLAKLQSSSTNQNIKQAKKSLQQPNSTKVVQPKQKSFLKNEIKRNRVEENLGDDNVDISSIVRGLYRRNGKHLREDDDDDDDDDDAAMVSTFDDIMREERNSAKIARKEDEIELLRNKQEEKQEKLRQAKKQKL